MDPSAQRAQSAQLLDRSFERFDAMVFFGREIPIISFLKGHDDII